MEGLVAQLDQASCLRRLLPIALVGAEVGNDRIHRECTSHCIGILVSAAFNAGIKTGTEFLRTSGLLDSMKQVV